MEQANLTQNLESIFDKFARAGLSIHFMSSDLQNLLQRSILFFRPDHLEIYCFPPNTNKLSDLGGPVVLRQLKKLNLMVRTVNSSIEAISDVLSHCKSATMDLEHMNPAHLVSFFKTLSLPDTFTEDFEIHTGFSNFEIPEQIQIFSQHHDSSFSAMFMKESFDVTLILDVFPRPDGSVFVLYNNKKSPGSNPMFKVPYFKGRRVCDKDDFAIFLRETIKFATMQMVTDDQTARCIDHTKVEIVRQDFFV